jgi:hypothetical protein
MNPTLPITRMWTQIYSNIFYFKKEGKVEVVLCLINSALRHEEVRGSGDIAPPFFTSALDGGVSLSSRPGHFNPRKTAPGIHCIGGWVGPTADLDAMDWRKICCFDANKTPAVQPIAHSYSSSTLFNKKFWEELIACLIWYDTDRIENDASKNSSIVRCVFVAAVTFLPSHCLATIKGYTYRHRLIRGI